MVSRHSDQTVNNLSRYNNSNDNNNNKVIINVRDTRQSIVRKSESNSSSSKLKLILS